RPRDRRDRDARDAQAARAGAISEAGRHHDPDSGDRRQRRRAVDHFFGAGYVAVTGAPAPANGATVVFFTAFSMHAAGGDPAHGFSATADFTVPSGAKLTFTLHVFAL